MVLIFLILLITLCAVSAQDNDTQIISQDMNSFENVDNELSIDYVENLCEDSQIDTQIGINELDWYCNENNSYGDGTGDENRICPSNNDLKLGNYKMPVQIKDSKAKVTAKAKTPAGEDCCSFYLQVSDTEAVGGFRRDNLGSTTITVKPCIIKGLSAVKHYNSNGFVHLIVFSNG